MACSIVIDETTLLATLDANGDTVRIEIEGDATDCKTVTVTFRHVSNGSSLNPIDVTPDAAGHFSASVTSAEQSEIKDYRCGDDVVVIAECKDKTCSDNVNVPLPCDGACPNVTVTASAGACNTAGTARVVTFAITVSGSQSIDYRLNFGDGSVPTAVQTGNGSFTRTHSYAAGPTAQTYFASLTIVAPAGCLADPDPIRVVIEACNASTGCPDNPRLRAEHHLPRGRREVVDLGGECVPPGDYTISVSNAFPAGTELFWSVNDGPSVQAATVDVTVDAGETVEIEVIATKSGCLPVSERIEISGCQTCENDSELVVERRVNGRSVRVDIDDGCIPPGNYVVRLLEPTGPLTVVWFENGVIVDGPSGTALRVRLGDGETLRVTALVQLAGCPPLNPSIELQACDCSDDTLSLTVFDEDGDEVDLRQCVAAGAYVVRAEGADLRDAGTEIIWSVNGANVGGNGTEQGITITSAVVAGCSDPAPVTVVSASVQSRGCAERSASARLTLCAEYIYNSCCENLGFVVLLLAGLTGIALALALCPTVLVLAPLVAFFQAAGWWIVLGLVVVLLAVLIPWLLICKPDWCRQIVPKIWQASFIMSITFLYFGTCPTCAVTPIGPLFVWGAVLFGVGLTTFIFWLTGCKPSNCEVIWRLLELGNANIIISAIELIMGNLALVSGIAPCAAPWASLLLIVLNAALFSLRGLLPEACNFNPFGGGGGGVRAVRLPVRRAIVPIRRQAMAAKYASYDRADHGHDAETSREVLPAAKAKKKGGCGCGCGGKQRVV